MLYGLIICVMVPIFILTVCVISGVLGAYKKYRWFRGMVGWVHERVWFSVWIRLVFMTYLNVLVAANVGSIFTYDKFGFEIPAVVYLALAA